MVGGSDGGWTRRDVLRMGGVAGGLMLLPAALAGCSSGTSTTAGGSDEKVTLTYWDTNAGPDRTPLWQKMLSQFEKANKNITVKYVGIPEAQYVQKLQTAIAGGQVPDVANGLLTNISPFIAENGLLPLDGYFASWKGKSDFADGVLEPVRVLSASKKLYAMPFTSNVNVLYYRKDLVKQAGLPDPGSSWDAFFACAEGLNKPSSGMYGFGLRGGSGSVNQLESWLYAATGISEFFDGSGHATLSESAMVTALKKFVGMYGKVSSQADVNSDYRAMVAEFDGGHAAMIFHNLGSFTAHTQALGADKVGVTVLPPAPNGKLAIEGMAQTGNMVLKGSKHPQQAWQLASFLATAQEQGPYNEAIGQAPTSTAALGQPWVKSSAAVTAARKALSAKDAVIVNAPAYLPAYATIQLKMEPELQKVLQGQLDEKTFLQEWAGQLNDARAQYKGTK